MKKSTSMFTGCAMLLLVSSAAHGGAAGPYVSFAGGLATTNDADAKETEGTIEFHVDPGIALAGAIGYDFGGNVRMESELSYQQNDVDKLDLEGYGFSVRNVRASGEIASLSGLLNGYYDFFNQSALTPFVSLGIGFTKVKITDLDMTLGNEHLVVDDDPDGTAVAYQVGGGLSYSIGYMIALDLKYRYFSAIDLKLDDVEFEHSSHNVYGGIRASF